MTAAGPGDSFTGERVTPEGTPEALFREHGMRYVFAGRFVQGQRVVDVACGSGMGTDLLARMGARECVGLDVSVDAVTAAARRYPRSRFAACDATRLALREASVDVIVSLETLEHLHEPEAFVTQCARALRPGGAFVVSTPNRPVYRWLGENPFHVREFTRGELLALLARHFAACELHVQNEVRLPWFVVRRTAMNALAALRVKEALKRVLRPSWSMPRAAAEYDPGMRFPADEVRPESKRAWTAPLFYVAVARKADATPPRP